MAKKEKKELEKKGWISSFTLVGEANINQYTYKIDEKSTKSSWIYNQLNLGVYCGEKSGTVYAEMMGGYGAERDNVIYVHGKNEDGTDDFKNIYTIDWDDREDETILEDIGDMCFIRVGLERDAKGKLFVKRFLSAYDAISYIEEHLEKDMVISVHGRLVYSKYEDTVTVRKEIDRIMLVPNTVEKNDYRATFTQTMLLTKDSVGTPDKQMGIIPIYGYVLDYCKEINGVDIKKNIPYLKAFEYEADLTNKERTKAVVDKVFAVKRGVNEITFEGVLVEGGATVTATVDDLPDDIKNLIDIGVYTEEEALDRCTISSGRAHRMIITKPRIKMVEVDGTKVPQLQRVDRKYEEDDLIIDEVLKAQAKSEDDDEDDADIDEPEIATMSEVLGEDDDSGDDWLDQL